MKYRIQCWKDKVLCAEKEIETSTYIGLYDTYIEAYYMIEGLTNVTAVLIGSITEEEYE